MTNKSLQADSAKSSHIQKQTQIFGNREKNYLPVNNRQSLHTKKHECYNSLALKLIFWIARPVNVDHSERKHSGRVMTYDSNGERESEREDAIEREARFN